MAQQSPLEDIPKYVFERYDKGLSSVALRLVQSCYFSCLVSSACPECSSSFWVGSFLASIVRQVVLLI